MPQILEEYYVRFITKTKYKFNPESLKFDKVRTSVVKTIVRFFTFFTATVAITLVYYLIYSKFFNTPKERILWREINQMTDNYATLNKNLQQIKDVLTDIQQRDSNIYRIIFESEPVPQTVLRAGFGGTNSYETLEGYSSSELMIENTRRSDILLKQLQIQSKMMDEMLERVQEKSELLRTIPSIQPIENKDLANTAAGFGMRMHPIYRVKMLHEGMDFAAPVGTPVRATAPGVVIETRANSAQGSKVVIDHGNGYRTAYTHLDSYTVKQGQKIKRGDTIGTVGNPSISIAPHLHYVVYKNGKQVDPINYFFSELSPAAYARIRDLSNLGRTFD